MHELTLVKITPLELSFFKSSKTFEKVVNNSKFRLLTGGLFRVTVEKPVLSFTSTKTKSFFVFEEEYLTELKLNAEFLIILLLNCLEAARHFKVIMIN